MAIEKNIADYVKNDLNTTKKNREKHQEIQEKFKEECGRLEQEFLSYFTRFYSRLSEKIIEGTVCHIEGNKIEIVVLNKLLYISFSASKSLLGDSNCYRAATLVVKDYPTYQYHSDPNKEYLKGKKMGIHPYENNRVDKYNFELFYSNDEFKWFYINRNNNKFPMSRNIFEHIIQLIFKDFENPIL